MMRWLLLFIWLPLSAFELSIQSGKEDGDPYSVLHLRSGSPFHCQAITNDFGDTIKALCTPPEKIKTFTPIRSPLLNVSMDNGVIAITPKYKMRLAPIGFDLKQSPQTYKSDMQKIRHWSVIAYPKQFTMVDQKGETRTSINLPVKITQDIVPYIGGLDLKGNPIRITRVQDVTDYMKMKKAYQNKDYDTVIELAKNTLEDFPDTVFKNELLLYQIRANHEKGNSEELIDLSKQFLRNYSSDPYVAEVLAYSANAYSKIGQSADADYFFDRLFDEHPSSPFAGLGMIYKAQQLEASGDQKKAITYYQKALKSSSDVEIASKAAMRLATIELGSGNKSKAIAYIDKINNGNPDYFSKVKEESNEIIQTLVDRNASETAAKITKALLKNEPKKTENHELLLKNLGMQLAQSDQKEKALERFNEYLSTYKYGQYVEEVQRAKDGLFFVEKDQNTSTGIKNYDALIERYGDDSIGRKALYKKAQLLVKEKEYQKVLDMDSQLYRLDTQEYPEVNSMITTSAIGLCKENLKNKKCNEAMSLQRIYKIKLLPQWDGLMHECAILTANYPLAKSLAKRHIKSSSVEERQLWLSRLSKTQFSLGEYKEAKKGGTELAKLLEVQKNPQFNDVYRTLFDIAQRQGDNEGMVKNIKSIEESFGNDFGDIERYSQMVSLGLKSKDEALVQNYARKTMVLQDKTKSYTQTPYIEFTLVQSYLNSGKNKEALDVLKSLDKRKLTNEKRSRQQYLIGSLYLKMGKTAEAKKTFNSAIKADGKSAWGKLAKDALGLL